ncbi:MAG: ArsR family transcriptional regulator [Candidatus Dormibacteraeota bacterium]|nr:ArsR family transcriptional regulator [Candidatus Dormibacteraeota bacterium]
MPNPRLRQTVSPPPPFAAALEGGTGYEALLALSMFTGDEPQESYEVGKAWFARARAAASPGLVTSLRRLAGSEGARWFLLLGLVHEAGGSHDVKSVLSHLRAMPAADVLIALIGGRLPALRTAEGRMLVKAALTGEAKAIAALAARGHASDSKIVKRLLAMGASEVKRLTVEVVNRWDGEVFSPMGDNGEALAEDVTAKTKAARRLSPHQLVDFATGGINYEGEAGIDRVLLIPSIVTRPWITISEWESTKIICYRAGLAGATASGEPARDMVLVYRALGDETRLRLLRELAGGDRRLAEMVQSLGLSKSTLHGHLAVLRSAGLIRLSLGAEKRYGLRPGLPDLNRLLADYMGRIPTQR